jgi:RimJ/RimL family protein N-acetyltransferase
MSQSQPFALLEPAVLARRGQLPEKPISVKLIGKYVYFEPLVIKRDIQPLFEMSNGTPITLGERKIEAYHPDELIWRYLFEGPFESVTALQSSLESYVNTPNGLCFCVFDTTSQRQVGVVNLLNNIPAHLKIEMGGIWYSPIVQRTQANTEATYLLLKHLFELGYRRVEWKCNAQNERSRRAALRMGFKFEGIQESHLIVKGRNRDTAWYRILEAEWPEVKEKLELSLYQ